jgi:hypothetical protein
MEFQKNKIKFIEHNFKISRIFYHMEMGSNVYDI